MLRRLRGVFVITRALLPFIVVVALAIVTWLMGTALVDTTTEYGRQMAAELEAIQQALDEANDGLEAIGVFVGATARAADDLVGRVADIPDAITLPLPDISIPGFTIPVLGQTIELPDLDLGDLDVPVPGITAIRSLAEELVAAGESIADPILKTAALADVPPRLKSAAEHTVDYADDVRGTVWGWMIAVLLVLLLAGIVWAIAALRPITSELSRGWAMVRGRRPPDKELRSLEKRVRALERELRMR